MGHAELKEAALWFTIATLFIFLTAFEGPWALAGGLVGLIILATYAWPRLKTALDRYPPSINAPQAYASLRFYLLGIAAAMAGGLLEALHLGPIGPVIRIIGVLLILVAQILLGLLLYTIGRHHQNDLMSIGGIVEIFIPFAGWALVYIAAEAAARAPAPTPPPPPQPPTYPTPSPTPPTSPQPTSQPPSAQPPTPPLPSSVPPAALLIQPAGLGRIDADGNAEVALSSNGTAKVLSARLDVAGISSPVQPDVISPGLNRLKASFGKLTLTPGAIYTITIELEGGRTVKVNAVYSPGPPPARPN